MSSLPKRCPLCRSTIPDPAPTHCPTCSFSIEPLIGQGTLSTHQDKWDKHSDLVYGRNIRLGLGSPGYNASFDPEIVPLLPEIVWQAFTFGEPTILPKPGRPHPTPYIFFDTHRRIGAGTAQSLMGTVPCTVIALVSATHGTFAHDHPVVPQWLAWKFFGCTSRCQQCGMPTPFGQTICATCFSPYGLP